MLQADIDATSGEKDPATAGTVEDGLARCDGPFAGPRADIDLAVECPRASISRWFDI